MITRTFKLCLNAGTGSAPYINVSQYDEGETWLFELYSETGERYIPTTGAIVGVKSDGHGIVNTGTVDSEGRVVIAETQQMTASAGRAIYELSIDGLTHGTANFIVAVERKPTDDAVMSDSDLSLIQEAIDSAEVIVEVIGDGDPSEVIGEHVDAWLDEHPEATTTVLDGAITAPKINNSLWDKILVNEEASGAVASFDDGADDVPVSSLKVSLEPIQIGSGDPSPSNIRPIIASNGKNFVKPAYTSKTVVSGITITPTMLGVRATGTATARVAIALNAYGTTEHIDLTTGEQVTFSLCVNGSIANAETPFIGYYKTGNTYGGNVGNVTPSEPKTWTVPSAYGDATDSYIRAYIYLNSGETYDFEIGLQCERGSSASAYQPYQGIMVERCGKNVMPFPYDDSTITRQGVTFTVNGDGTLTLSGTATGNAFFNYSSGLNTPFQLSAGTYTKIVPTQSGLQFDIYKLDNTALSTGNNATFTLAETTLCYAYLRVASGTSFATPTTVYPQIERGSEATEYEQYAGNSYPYTLGREVYGGTVDLATGVLTVDKEIVDLGTLTWGYVSSGSPFFYAAVSDIKRPSSWSVIPNWICSGYKTVSGNDASGGVTGIGGNPSNSQVSVCDSSYTDAATFKSAMDGVQLVYELATPQTYQLTPTQVKTLLGYNNISSSGTVDAIYHADTKLYVDKMTAVDNNIIAPTEETFTATRNYTTNDLVIVNDTLYKVTANIATGSAITPNSNVTATTLSTLIKALS